MTSSFVPEQRERSRPLRSLLRRVIPRDRRFFALFDRHAALCVEGVSSLAQLLADVRDPGGRVRLQVAAENAGRMPVDVTYALDLQLRELVRIARDDARVVHHLGEPDHPATAKEPFEVPGRECPARRLEP